MPHMVFCARYKQEMEGLDEPPFDSDFGHKIYNQVSKKGLGRMGGAAEDATERVPPAALDTGSPGVPGGADAGVFLRRGVGSAQGVRSPHSLRTRLLAVVYTQEVVFPVGTWLSLVEHSLGVRGVGSSNLPVPTIKINHLQDYPTWIPRLSAGTLLAYLG